MLNVLALALSLFSASADIVIPKNSFPREDTAYRVIYAQFVYKWAADSVNPLTKMAISFKRVSTAEKIETTFVAKGQQYNVLTMDPGNLIYKIDTVLIPYFYFKYKGWKFRVNFQAVEKIETKEEKRK